MAYQGIAYDLEDAVTEVLNSGLITSLVTIQQPDGLINPNGTPSGTFVAVSGLSNVPCQSAVPAASTIQATETKDLQEILSKAYRHVFIPAYYPQILAGVGNGWRAVVDGVTYDLLGAEVDSQQTQTRLHLQLVTV